eukprot:TRINITY_DN2388_c0_g1_i1.p1 TRINITY_DN2388_c0_g1~~TRINITY_DN2388_c0_g1_i1.p1  ORF type:complete len:270 (-),score=76.98 TRINITY_DN2388_c0_g1_i1:4-813(-)
MAQRDEEIENQKKEIDALKTEKQTYYEKQIINQTNRINQLEAQLKDSEKIEVQLRSEWKSALQFSKEQQVEYAARIHLLEATAQIAKDREKAKIIRPIQSSSSLSSSTLLSSLSSSNRLKDSALGSPTTTNNNNVFLSLFEGKKNTLPAATSLRHDRDSNEHGDSSIFKEGYLTKQGSLIKRSWKKRWVILHSCTLYYYTPQKKEPRGKLELDALCVAQEADDFTQKSFSFGIFHPLKQPFFCVAESAADRSDWILSIRSACNSSFISS